MTRKTRAARLREFLKPLILTFNAIRISWQGVKIYFRTYGLVEVNVHFFIINPILIHGRELNNSVNVNGVVELISKIKKEPLGGRFFFYTRAFLDLYNLLVAADRLELSTLRV